MSLLNPLGDIFGTEAAKANADSSTAIAASQSQAAQSIAQMQANAQTTIAGYQKELGIHQSDNMLAGMTVQSNNMLAISQTNAEVAKLGIQENNATQRWQAMLWLVEQQEALDTKLQIAVKNAEVSLKELDNDYKIEKGRLKNEARELEVREQEIAQANSTAETQSFLV